MSSDRLRPIPTSLSQRWRQIMTSVLPAIVFCGAILAITLLWHDRVGASASKVQSQGGVASDDSRPSDGNTAAPMQVVWPDKKFHPVRDAVEFAPNL